MPPIAVPTAALSADLRAALPIARTLGFAGVQLPVSTPNLAINKLAVSGLREVRTVLTRHEQALFSLGTTTGRLGFGPGADLDRLLDHLSQSLKSAADLGAPVLCIDMGPLPPAPAEERPAKPVVTQDMAGLILLPPSPAATPVRAITPPMANPAFESQLAQGLAMLASQADRYSVRIAFRSQLNPIRDLHHAIARIGSPHFGLDLDPALLLAEDGPASNVLASAVADFAGRLFHVRLRDALCGAANRLQPVVLGQGAVNVEELVALLDDAAYSGPLLVDPSDLPDRIGAAEKGLAAVRQALKSHAGEG